MTTETNDAGEKRYEFTASERRCLELLLAPAEHLRREAARIETSALLEVRQFVVDRVGLPANCPIRIERIDGRPVAVRVGASVSATEAPVAPPGDPTPTTNPFPST